MEYEKKNDFGYEILSGFKKAALKQNTNVFIEKISIEFQKEMRYDAFMLKNNYSGAFLLGFSQRDPWSEELKTTKVPTVLLDYRIPGNNYISSIGVDTLEGMQKIIDYLLSQGHKKIGYLGSHAYSYIFRQRIHSYHLQIHNNHLEFDDSMMGNEDNSKDCIDKHFQHVYESGCTAIICSHDQLAHQVLFHCENLGIQIPEDLSIISIDNIAMSEVSFPPLTTLDQNKELIGNAAFSTLHSQCNGIHISRFLLHSDIVIRKSVKNLNEKG